MGVLLYNQKLADDYNTLIEPKDGGDGTAYTEPHGPSIYSARDDFSWQDYLSGAVDRYYNSAIAELEYSKNNELLDKQNAFNASEAEKARKFNSEEAAKAREFNAFQAELQRQYEQNMSSSAYQRAFEDARKAGLNPYILYDNGSASTPSGAAASGSAASGSSAHSSNAAAYRVSTSRGNQQMAAMLTSSLISSAATLMSSIFRIFSGGGASVVKNFNYFGE